MIFLCDSGGTIQAAIPSPIHQGSIGVNEIILIAPFPSSTVVTATFTLPNGIKIYPKYVSPDGDPDYPYLMAVVNDFAEKNVTIDGVTANVWRLTLDKAITQVSGNVTIQFIFSSVGGINLTSSSATLPVLRGNAYLEPTVELDDAQLMNDLLGAALRAANAANDAESSAAESATAALTQANRASPWDIVITPANEDSIRSISTLSTKDNLRSILFLNVDFRTVDGIENGLFFPGNLEVVVFRGCQFGDMTITLSNTSTRGNIEGVIGDNVTLEGFFVVENCKVKAIVEASRVAHCNAKVLDRCGYVTGTTADTLEECSYVSPYSVKGYVFDEDVGKVPVLTLDGSKNVKELPQGIRFIKGQGDNTVIALLVDDNGTEIARSNEFTFVGGGAGTAGYTFFPTVSPDGFISWTNNGGLPNPDPVNIKGVSVTGAYIEE